MQLKCPKCKTITTHQAVYGYTHNKWYTIAYRCTICGTFTHAQTTTYYSNTTQLPPQFAQWQEYLNALPGTLDYIANKIRKNGKKINDKEIEGILNALAQHNYIITKKTDQFKEFPRPKIGGNCPKCGAKHQVITIYMSKENQKYSIGEICLNCETFTPRNQSFYTNA
jgi:transcription elongation factor Elf1